MFYQTYKKRIILFLGILMLSLPGCGGSTPTPPPVSGCNVPDLITAIEKANVLPDHDHIILPEYCDYELSKALFEVPDPSQNINYGYAGLPPIYSPITITGNGSRIFRTYNPETELFRIFYIGSGGSLALVDLSLENGYARNYGGGVLIEEGTLSLTQSTLANNRANSRGGAVGVESGELYLVNSVLRDNEAHTGGAIFSRRGTVDIDFESLLENNEARVGGAIYMTGGDLTIYNSTIRGSGSGGGIKLSGVTGFMQGVIIEDNLSNSNGGGINAHSGSLTIRDSLIAQNQAAGGGGLSINYVDLSLTNTQIINNAADEIGGGVNIEYSTIAQIEGCTIGDNQSGVDGGGIGVTVQEDIDEIKEDAFEPIVSITDSTIAANTTLYKGGGIFIAMGEWEILNSTISGNAAMGGGGIFNYGVLDVINTTISDNTAEEGGGVLHASQTVSDFSFVTVAENTAISGGGLEVDSTAAHITNSLVAHNAPENCLGNVQAFGKNLDDDGSCGFVYTDDPLLDPLGDYGGPTFTHQIPNFSPAAEVADPCTIMNGTLPLAGDQRGESRPQGGGCDLGAVEALFDVIPIPPIPSPCLYTAIKNANCRESDHTQSAIVTILMKDETANLIAVNPENTVGKFELASGEECWIAFYLMSAGDLAEACQVPVENPPEPELQEEDPPGPEPPEQMECKKDLGENDCKKSGGEWIVPLVEAPYCSCP